MHMNTIDTQKSENYLRKKIHNFTRFYVDIENILYLVELL